MDKLQWCIRQRNGIEIIEQNDNLCNEYLEKSENALKAIKSLEGNKEWQISSAYYSMYFSLYAILMKIGVKCEIHSCTMQFAKEFLNNHLSKEDLDLLQTSLTARIDAQYYTDRNVEDKQHKKMVLYAPTFNLKCREIITTLSDNKIKKIRGDIKKLV